jgi:hypothetical protein
MNKLGHEGREGLRSKTFLLRHDCALPARGGMQTAAELRTRGRKD